MVQLFAVAKVAADVGDGHVIALFHEHSFRRKGRAGLQGGQGDALRPDIPLPGIIRADRLQSMAGKEMVEQPTGIAINMAVNT